ETWAGPVWARPVFADDPPSKTFRKYCSNLGREFRGGAPLVNTCRGNAALLLLSHAVPDSGNLAGVPIPRFAVPLYRPQSGEGTDFRKECAGQEAGRNSASAGACDSYASLSCGRAVERLP